MTRAQVTLDGPREIHDARRFYRGGQPSFERILSNLQIARDILPLIIRINVDSENRVHIPELVRVLRESGIFDGKCKAVIYASPVVPYTEQARMLWRPIEQTELPSLGQGIETSLEAVGLTDRSRPTHSLLDGNRGGCNAMQHHSFVIGPKGHLFKCELGIHDQREAVGHVLTTAAEEPAARRRLPLLKPGVKALDWDAYNPYDNESCSSCQFVPICKSGCPKKVMEGAEDFMKATCDYWDINFSELLHQALSEASR
ncbi:SPASM domain-containing protein [Pendulispora rubella]|uniref:SPASM domain-containing protein n=1 Tax=Pendulispora rubella TaxID=2741070 RepID=A0ABZ2L1N7_9BACT